MKDLFFMGGPTFMGILTVLFVITTAWIVYHFILAYYSKQTNREKMLRRIEYGKSLGLFSMVTGIVGQMIGLYSMFSAIEGAIKNGEEIIPALVFGGIKVTMIVTIYGMLIYLFSLLLWFVANTLIEKRLKIK
ncbi:MAG: MotA/TolQ/ExbB proton channel family protein [Bacteroidales bacterium]